MGKGIKIFIALAPKVYFIITEGGEIIRKIKGVSSKYSNNVTLEDFKNLLYKDNVMNFVQEK